MFIYPAIDLYEGKAVRLFKGDYAQMEVFSQNPPEVAKDFESCGATHIHLVDLEGAKNGKTPNFDTVMKIHNATDMFCEIGGGIRSMETVEMHLENGIDRVILGTAAVNDRKFLERAVGKYKDRIAVGVDIRDGFVAIKGWTEKSELEAVAQRYAGSRRFDAHLHRYFKGRRNEGHKPQLIQGIERTAEDEHNCLGRRFLAR